MKIPEHVALSFLLAQLGVQQQYGPAGTALMIAAGCLPDADGVSLLGGWRLYRACHRVLGHGILVTLFGPALLAWVGGGLLALGRIDVLWSWLQAALLAHLFTDVLFYRWPVRLLWPFSGRAWAGGLVGWNDLVPTLALYGGTAVCLARPPWAPAAAATSCGLLLLYLGRRACWPRPRAGWRAWLAGGWAVRAPRVCKWLTGDFVT